MPGAVDPTFFFDFDRGGIYDFLNRDPWRQLPGRLASGMVANLFGRLGYGLYTMALARRRLGAGHTSPLSRSGE